MWNGCRGGIVPRATVTSGRRLMNQPPTWWDTAQVCLNGHVVNEYSVSQPHYNAPRCPECGEPTITACANCSTPIRGRIHDGGFPSLAPFTRPPYCHSCGEAYPWTERAI